MADLDGRCDASGLICEDWTQLVRLMNRDGFWLARSARSTGLR
jgi:hypothetical protein